MAEIANNLIGKTVYQQQRQGVSKENPAFSYATPPHTFKDFASANYLEDTTTELAIGYAKEIVEHMYANRYQNKTAKDPISDTYYRLFHRQITAKERADLGERPEDLRDEEHLIQGSSPTEATEQTLRPRLHSQRHRHTRPHRPAGTPREELGPRR